MACANHKPIKKQHGERGSITLEATIALPIFFCVIIAIAFLLRAVQVHERMQHAISQAALEIAGISYVYGISGALDIQREADALVARGVDKIEDVVVKSAQLDNWLSDSASGEVSKQFVYATAALTDRINGALFSHYAGFVTRKYLGDGTEDGKADSKADALGGANIDGGGQGLDFIRSTYLTNGSEEVKVSVRYSFNIPIPIKSLSRLTISQEASARAWLYGAGANTVQEDPHADEEDIWALGNFERGDRIQEIFHANLPKNFPVLASFSNGVATSIHSLDTTAASYQSAAGVGKRIDEYVKNIKDYQGQEKPFGSEGIVIKPEDITARRLVLVIPRNDISPEVSTEIDRCIRDALAQGVVLQVERYARKHIDGEEDGE